MVSTFLLRPICKLLEEGFPESTFFKFRRKKTFFHKFTVTSQKKKYSTVRYLPSQIQAVCLLLTIGLSLSNARSQSIALEDYERAVSFLWSNVENKTAFNLQIQPHWLPDSTGFWWINHSPNSKEYRYATFTEANAKPLFDHARLATALQSKFRKRFDPKNLVLNDVEKPSTQIIRFTVEGTRFELNVDNYSIVEHKENKKVASPYESTSPDGKWVAYTENYNLFIRSTETGAVHQLSKNGRKNYEYGSYYGWFDKMEGEGGERPRRFNVNWSPDSKYLQTYICDLRSANKMYMLDWSVDTLYRPRLLSYYRGSPGDTNMVHLIPTFYSLKKKKQLSLNLPRLTHINSISFRWSKTTGQAYGYYQDRGFQNAKVLQLDLTKNRVITLVTDNSKTNIDNFRYWLAEEQDKLVFASERSGWRQLYSLDLKKGGIRPLALGSYYTHDILHISSDGWVYVLAAGKDPRGNPYHQSLYKLRIEGGDPILLTPEEAHHSISFAPNGQYFIDNYSTASQPTRTVLRDTKSGKVIMELGKANISALKAKGWKAPDIFTAIGRDGKTKIYGALWKPTNFNPAKKYPIIDHSYTGPHTQVFPKDFRRALSVSNQALAELGFIVMMVDGLGSSGRSKEFHNYSYKNMGYNLADHVLAMRQLAQRYPWIDLDRVGIFGHSAGGYDAGHAMLQFPDFYKVAVASSADHDFRMEKAWWPEMYMGWPVDSSYHRVSNVTMADRLKGKLLLVHGALDDNVNASATFKLAEALVKADKQFDLLILPSQRHGYRGKYMDYFRKKRWNYFVEHLLGADPIWDFSWQ
ncbi:MAG: prolyl oligopeptidase family serine peptidase [Saprospiraceae bacterium]|nr:prolyl oligopeptidase family serine peptidase [Saprospiraceae bacterium]